jgi:hypothetical protein
MQAKGMPGVVANAGQRGPTRASSAKLPGEDV